MTGSSFFHENLISEIVIQIFSLKKKENLNCGQDRSQSWLFGLQANINQNEK